MGRTSFSRNILTYVHKEIVNIHEMTSHPFCITLTSSIREVLGCTKLYRGAALKVLMPAQKNLGTATWSHLDTFFITPPIIHNLYYIKISWICAHSLPKLKAKGQCQNSNSFPSPCLATDRHLTSNRALSRRFVSKPWWDDDDEVMDHVFFVRRDVFIFEMSAVLLFCLIICHYHGANILQIWSPRSMSLVPQHPFFMFLPSSRVTTWCKITLTLPLMQLVWQFGIWRLFILPTKQEHDIASPRCRFWRGSHTILQLGA